MPWSAGTFSRYYGATGWADDRDAATPITASRFDTHDQDLADGINACLAKDGSNAATGDLNMGGNQITNVGTPANATDAATKGYVDTATTLAFTAGDQILFRNAAGTAPSGWAIVAQNNKALRIVSGVPSSGGATAFTSVFNNSVSISSSGTHTHTTGTSSTGATIQSDNTGGNSITPDHTHSISSSGAHTHSFTMPNLQYYDMNLIQKS